MTHAELRDALLSLPQSTSDFPFDERTEVFRIQGKIFALSARGQAGPVKVNLKCDPDLAVDLRASYPEVVPGWHMNHRHWNTVTVDGAIPDDKLLWMIRHSYDCVVAGLPKKRAAKAPASPI
jgi:predicted DNA-binding protein (MmcQ/YjbR family)